MINGLHGGGEYYGSISWNHKEIRRWDEDGEGSIGSVAALHGRVSLAMDGRWCLWDLENRCLVHQGGVYINRRDYGEEKGADAWDRSSRPLSIPKTHHTT